VKIQPLSHQKIQTFFERYCILKIITDLGFIVFILRRKIQIDFLPSKPFAKKYISKFCFRLIKINKHKIDGKDKGDI